VSHRPQLTGAVVASLSIDRQREARLCFYRVARAAYPETAQEEMVSAVLPGFRAWLRAKRAEPPTAILGHYQLIAEWTAAAHRRHEVRYL
jgi:hypothetical protein